MKASEASATGSTWYRTSRILWAAFTGSILLYFVVAITAKPFATAENAGVERVLIALAAAYVAISVPAKKWLLVQAREVDSDLLRRFSLLVPLVLCELAAITGLALRLITGSSLYYVFLLLAFAGMLLHFPRRSDQN